MKSIVKIIFLLSLVVLIKAQADEESGQDTRPIRRRNPFGFLSKNPVESIAKRVGDRVRESSDRLRDNFRNIIDEVKTRTNTLFANTLSQVKTMKAEVKKARARQAELIKELKLLDNQIQEVNQTFIDTKMNAKTDLQNEKYIIVKQIESTGSDDSTAKTELEDTANDIDKKIKEVDGLILGPDPRGLGDGYGRHL